MIAALVLAAGQGVRFGADGLPKQFCEIAGKPLFIHSVTTYAALPEIDRIVVTANPSFFERMGADLARYGLTDAVTLVAGGQTRQVSVRNAAAALGPLDALGRDDLVIVHNAASPNTNADYIRKCIACMPGYDAVQACVPDTRTVFEKSGELVARVLPRALLVYNCDPLIYRADVFAHLLLAQRERGSAGETTSDTALELGYRIRLVESTYDNIKVTTPWDLAAVEATMARS